MPDLSDFPGRLLPRRADLAAAWLGEAAGSLPRVEPRVASVCAPLLDLAQSPAADAERATQLLRGERFAVYAEADGMAWGQSLEDGYVGYVPAAGLGAEEPVGRLVTALRAHVYPAPDIKTRSGAALPMGARAVCAGEEGSFARLASDGWLCVQHLAPVAGDAVDHAARFLGVPYLWGGRTADGIDCSGLVQAALGAVGVAAPRDTDMQETWIGEALGPDEAPRRGDLVFWRGHVGLMADKETLIHANAHHMAVTREPLAAVCARVEAAGGGPITSRRRGAEEEARWLPEVPPG